MTAETDIPAQDILLPTLAVVIPVFNEEAGVAALAMRLGEVLVGLADYHIVFVDDGSSDNTAAALKAVSDVDDRVKYILLSKNCGHQTAMRAGLEHVDADCIVTMDGDFQHPPEFIPTMIAQWRKGAKVVLTRRTGEQRLSAFKRSTSGVYYRLLNGLSDVQLEEGAADFRLVDRSVLTSLRRFTEHDIFYRGIIPLVGYKVVTLNYELQDRRFGKSKYSLRKMLRLGIKGVLSSSTKPLRLAMVGAFAVFASAAIYLLYVLIFFFLVGAPLTGWTSVILTVLILGATQLFVLGIIGEYVGQLLIESRRRPSYFIVETNLDNLSI
ncbi:MAG: glycosyltransferase family 2 protein [Alphaproteobacteria bacterium]|nr:glycosyltransferase family 2 protein [Alphaproteobacteria bacterium]